MSLSARRAWIEIPVLSLPFGAVWVALRKESVDRNHQPTGISEMGVPSLSARRAWIEITLVASITTYVSSLSARRAWIEIWA